jgi:hypothetical protein
MIALASEALAATWVLVTKKPTPVAKQGEPMAFKTEKTEKAEKKEL